MNSDTYKIVISISRHRIAFEYWQRDGENRLVPISNVGWPVPLAFYCSPMGIEIGDVAVRAVNAGTANAFDCYFDRLASDETYLLGGRRQPLRYLLLEAAESIFADFFKNVLFGSKGSLADNRATMPLTIACEPDIQPNERALLVDIFRSSGYNRCKVTEYNDFIERYVREHLSGQYPCSKALVAWTEGSDLSLTLFDMRGAGERRQITLPGLGKDPRLDYVKHQIWDRIKGQNPWLMYEQEDEAISRAALDFLSSDVPLLNDTLLLSDGNSYHYSLNRTIIDNLQCDEGAEIKAKLEGFLRDNGVVDKSNALLILRGMASGNIFFEQTLCPGFREIIRSDRKLRDNVMKLLIADPNPTIPAPAPEERRVERVNKVQPGSNPESAPSPSPKPTPEPKHQVREEPKNEPSEKTPDKTKEKSENNKKSGFGFSAGSGFMSGLTSAVTSGFNGVVESVTETIGKASDVASAVVNELVIKPVAAANSVDLKALQREWRMKKADAKGKLKVGKTEEVRNLLSDFMKKCRQEGATDLARQVAAELETVQNAPASESKNASKGSVHSAKDEKTTRPARPSASASSSTVKIHRPVAPTTPPPIPGDQKDPVKTLIATGNFKEARDIYRSQGNTEKAKILNDLIRAKRSADMRIKDSEIEKYRNGSDKAGAKRVADELKEFVGLCEKAGCDCAAYKKAMDRYRKYSK